MFNVVGGCDEFWYGMVELGILLCACGRGFRM